VGESPPTANKQLKARKRPILRMCDEQCIAGGSTVVTEMESSS